jgi:hypothetical protein
LLVLPISSMPEFPQTFALSTPVASGHPAFDWARYGEGLVQAGKLAPRDLERALAATHEMGGALNAALVNLGRLWRSSTWRAWRAHQADGAGDFPDSTKIEL